ncbi:ATP12 family chaperone protein [Blastomonas sp.]|uniref:ATP12 family chaperone protein n=1 Tax=Blastomonas sp. TaxID=1909299 RepID=UPI00406AA406
MKRFYKTVTTEPVEAGHALLLDGRSVKTPLRAPLILPTAALAEAVAAEWDAQGEEIVIAAMPLTGFANAAIDQVVPHHQRFIDDIVAYGETDTLCYRADPGDPLAERQDRDWEPILQWAENRYDIRMIRVAGIIHQPQSSHSLSRLRSVVGAMDPFVLAGFSTLAAIGGSLIGALALWDQAFDSGTIWRAICLEELWQEELWGADAEAVAAREHRRGAFDAAWRFCCTIKG